MSGSPYAFDDAVLSALTIVRESGIPFLGTCGGMQYAVVEFARGVGSRLRMQSRTVMVLTTSSLRCLLALRREADVRPIPGTYFGSWAPALSRLCSSATVHPLPMR